MNPPYWNDAKAHLSRCPTMAGLIVRYEGEGLSARGEGFTTLIRAICGQQISVKAADAIWARLIKVVNPMTPENLLRKRESTLRKVGFSASKVAYARNVARFWVERGIDIPPPVGGRLGGGRSLAKAKRALGATETITGVSAPNGPSLTLPLQGREPSYWDALSDAEVVRELSGIKGIGVWTAEMFLIFHLLRADVFPVGDLAVLKAIDLHYTGGKRLKPKEYVEMAEAWAPYRSVATWYLWRALDPVPVAY